MQDHGGVRKAVSSEPRSNSEITAVIILICALAFFLCSCSQSRDERQSIGTEEKERTEIIVPPTVINTPFGQFQSDPATLLIIKDKVTNTTAVIKETSESRPSPAVMQAASGIGGLFTGGLGAVLLGVGWKAVQLLRQRNENFSGIEEAKKELPVESWEILKASLQKKQNKDTQAAAKKFTK